MIYILVLLQMLAAFGVVYNLADRNPLYSGLWAALMVLLIWAFILAER